MVSSFSLSLNLSSTKHIYIFMVKVINFFFYFFWFVKLLMFSPFPGYKEMHSGFLLVFMYFHFSHLDLLLIHHLFWYIKSMNLMLPFSIWSQHHLLKVCLFPTDLRHNLFLYAKFPFAPRSISGFLFNSIGLSVHVSLLWLF